MLRRLLLLACGLCCFVPSAALAQDTALWRTVGQWQIRIDASLGYGCFLLGSYTRGTVLRIGIDQQNGNGYVMVGNEAWRSLQVGNQYDLAMRFDSNSPWRGRATARRIGNGQMVFLYLSFDRARFLIELARRNNMAIFYQGDLVTSLPLRGTNAAVQEMLNCQRAADAARKKGPQGDPFAGSPQGPASGPGPGPGPSGPGPGPSGPGPSGPSPSGPSPSGPSPSGPSPSGPAPGGPTFSPGGPSSGPGPAGPGPGPGPSSGPGPGPGGSSPGPSGPGSSPGAPTFRPTPNQ
jgi:hypothetical protein